jgi:hypothetical protein
MRITLTLDDDVHFAVREAAKREGMTMGQALSELVRDSMIKKGLIQLADKSPKTAEPA